MSDVELSSLEKLEKKGALQLLIVLLEDGDQFITQLIKRTASDSGIVSQPTLEKTRLVLVKLGLVEEYEKYIELTNKTRIYIRLTEKGKTVAKHVKALAESLQ